MGRRSFNSKQNFLAATSFGAKKSSLNLSVADQIMETKLRSEQAKLALLEAEVPREDVKYMRYKDMPPPSPEQEAEFHARFRKIMREFAEAREKEGPEEGQTVQEWLTEQGATIPDLPEWKVPLYLEKHGPRQNKPSLEG